MLMLNMVLPALMVLAAKAAPAADRVTTPDPGEEDVYSTLETSFSSFMNQVLRRFEHIEMEEVLLALGLLVAFFLVMPFLGWALVRIQAKVSALLENHLGDLKIKGYTFVTRQQIIGFIHPLLSVIRVLGLWVLGLLIFVSLLNFIPTTRGIAVLAGGTLAMVGGVLGQAVWGYAPSFLAIIVIVLSAYYGLKGLRIFFSAIEHGMISFRSFYPDWARPTYNLIRFLVISLVVIIVAPLLPGFDSPAFKGVSVFLGVLLSLGSTSAVANVVAGVVLTYTRTFQVGDRVDITGTVGRVVDRNLLVTRIRTIDNLEVSIPNATVLNGKTVNWSRYAVDEGVVLATSVSIGYDTPWETVHRLLETAAKDVADVLERPAPEVLQEKLDDFYVVYTLRVWTAMPEAEPHVRSYLHQAIQNRFREAGVAILSPHHRHHHPEPQPVH